MPKWLTVIIALLMIPPLAYLIILAAKDQWGASF